MLKFGVFICSVFISGSFAGQAFAGDCAAGRTKFKAATTVQQVHEAIVVGFDAKTADDMLAEHGNTLSELKGLADQALAGCK